MNLISNRDKKQLKKAAKAQKKLADYCKGMPKGFEPTQMYYKLNRQASEEIKKLPAGLRSRAALDFLGH